MLTFITTVNNSLEQFEIKELFYFFFLIKYIKLISYLAKVFNLKLRLIVRMIDIIIFFTLIIILLLTFSLVIILLQLIFNNFYQGNFYIESVFINNLIIKLSIFSSLF